MFVSGTGVRCSGPLRYFHIINSKTLSQMKTFILSFSFLLMVFVAAAQNCPQGGCSITVNVLQDSCPSNAQTLYTVVSNNIRVCAADVPSLHIPDQTANYCTASDPSDAVNCPSTHYRTSHVSAPP